MKQRPWDKISLALTITVLLFLAATISATLVKPSFLPWLQLAPVFDFGFCIVSLLLVAVLMVKSRRMWTYGAVPLLMILVFVLRNPGVFRLQNVPLKSDIQLLSYNVQQFRNDTPVASGIAREIKTIGADVVCLQEFGLYYKWPDTESVIRDFAEQTGYPYYHFLHHKNNIFGLAVLSKHPILSGETLFMEPGPTNGAGKFILQTPKGNLVVINQHLESFNLHAEGLPEISGVVQKQGVQANLVLRSIPENIPVLVAGDFNSVRGSAVYNAFSKNMDDSYKASGSGGGATMQFWYPLAIDHIFYACGLVAAGHKTLSWDYSDHRPILSSFKLE